MANLIGDDMDEVARYISDVPPAHYAVKIESFSLLAKKCVDRFESGEFEAGGYKWKLVLHPLGDKSKNGNDHISLYLAIAGTDSLQPNWEVYVVYRLFLLDQNNDNYLTVEDGKWKPRRFRGMKKEWGFDKYISLKEFNESSNGYLVDDVCVFGAEVFVCKEKFKGGKGECLTMIKSPIIHKHVWKIDNFSKLDDAKSCESRAFNAGGEKWKIQVYPKGKGSGEGSHLSLFVALADPTALHPATKIYAEVKMSLQDQVHSEHHSGKVSYWFSASNPEVGGIRFILLSNFQQPNMGFLVKDSCIVEAEVNVLGVANALS